MRTQSSPPSTRRASEPGARIRCSCGQVVATLAAGEAVASRADGDADRRSSTCVCGATVRYLVRKEPA